jgi:D-glycero-alpha-D-manno-heptose-7-phosphate kinase
MSINRYVYVYIKSHTESFIESLRINYSETEKVNSINEIRNGIIREGLKEVYEPTDSLNSPHLYIATISDLRSESGLGSSSAFACTFVHALNVFHHGYALNADEIFYKAKKIEIERLLKPIGIQDQFASAYGGLRANHISSHGDVKTQRIQLSTRQKDSFNQCMFIVDSLIGRKADKITGNYSNPNENQHEIFNKLAEKSREFAETISQVEHHDIAFKIGEALNTSQELKEKLHPSVMTQDLQDLRKFLLDSGSTGAKLCGAGAGGYFFVSVDESQLDKFKHRLISKSIKYEKVEICEEGSEILLKI